MDIRTKDLPLPNDIKYEISKHLHNLDFQEHRQKFSDTLKLFTRLQTIINILNINLQEYDYYWYFIKRNFKDYFVKVPKNKFKLYKKVMLDVMGCLDIESEKKVLRVCKICGKLFKSVCDSECSNFCSHLNYQYAEAKRTGRINYNPFPIYSLRC